MAEPTTQITLREVYDILVQVRDTVNPLPEKVADHDTRIGRVERRMWLLTGGATVVGAIIGALIMQSMGA